MPPAVPDTPAGRVFGVWLDAYNASDSTRLDAYARQYEPSMSVHAQLAARMQTGAWEIASVDRSDPRYLAVVLRTGDASVARYSPITMYAAIEVTGEARLRATTSFALLGRQPRIPLRRMAARQRVEAIDSLVAKLTRNYVSLDVANRIADSLHARQARGVYDDYLTDVAFAMRLNNDLVALGTDRQLGVEYAWRVPLPPSSPTPAAMLHCGFDPPARLVGDVGYLRFYGLGEPDWDCGHEVSEVMHAVAGSRALIVDLRETTDDSRARMAYLASYLVQGCTHLGDIWDRATAQTEMLWTHDGLPGPAFGGTKPLYILTSARTFAAAEELAYDLQSLGRATVVGEATAGAAYTIASGQIGEHLLVRIPIARAINPITGSNWQRVGVVPDVPVAASEALNAAQQLIREGRVVHVRIAARGGPASAGNSAAVAILASSGRTPQGGGPTTLLRGIRFAIDTLVPFAEQRGLLSKVAGTMEFGDGRGRLDVTAVSHAPALVLDGIAVAEPLARPGDYYLFDNLGFILVRPARRTFSSFTFTRAEFNVTGALLTGAYLMGRSTIARVDTIPAGDLAARRQHGPITFHFHMQPRENARPKLEHGGIWGLLARGWMELDDAPGIEAGVARWFEVAAALATRPAGVSDIAPEGLEVTSVVRFARRALPSSPVHYLETLVPHRLAAADIDPARLAIPSDFVETPWGDGGRTSGVRAAARGVNTRWYAPEDALSQRRRAACRQAWLPEAHAAPSADAPLRSRSIKP
ncbi:MAG: S41 family peptidase [Gemmatimonadota bacterium]|nr:S41 family peptidase [Gemmatimonadota bacterium]